MKWKYYVAVIYDRKLHYVTKVCNSTRTAKWVEGERAVPMLMHQAENLVFGLCCNGYPATMLRMPDFMEPANLEVGQ